MTEIFAWGRRTDVGPGTGERFAHAREAVSVVRPAAERFSVSVVRVPLSNQQRSLPRPRRVYVSVFTGNHPGSTFRHSNDMGGLKQSQWTPTKRRGPIAAEFSGPGPAAVALPTLFGNLVPESKRGRAPAFSFGARHNEKNDSAGPGPGQYNITGLSAKGKDTPPSSTLHSRPKETRPDNFPAPGDYNPENSARAMHEHSPEYTFGLKTQLDKPSANPAPNVYNIPTVMGAAKEGHFRAAPSFSIAGRTKEFPDGRLLNPGPGAYNDVSADSIKPKSPAYTVSARYTVPGDSSPRPGPGAYSPEKVQVDLQPAHSFGIKHSPYSHTYGIGY